ncbi:hypothetical protein ACYATP_07145 [Lactobacillaceae bacterium Melli_B4]
MSNRSYLIGLYIGLATFAIGCLLLFGNFFANANNKQPKISHAEMHTIATDYQYFVNSKDKKAAPKIINNYYYDQFNDSNERNCPPNRIKPGQLIPPDKKFNNEHSNRSTS